MCIDKNKGLKMIKYTAKRLKPNPKNWEISAYDYRGYRIYSKLISQSYKKGARGWHIIYKKGYSQFGVDFADCKKMIDKILSK